MCIRDRLGEGQAEHAPDAEIEAGRERGAAAGGRAVDDLGQHRQQHQRQHHRDVLDDQPADGDAAALGLDQAPFLQGAQQDDCCLLYTSRCV